MLFLQILVHLVKWNFLLVFKIIEHHHQQQCLQFNFDRFFIVWGFFFNGVIRFLIYSSRGSRRRSGSGWLVNFHINIFIICVVTKWNWKRECKNISSHVRSPSVLFAKFVNLIYSVGHNGTRIFFNVEMMIFGW